MMYGATERPVRIHTDVIQFHNEAARPPRLFAPVTSVSAMRSDMEPANTYKHIVGQSSFYNYDLSDVRLPMAGTSNYGGYNTVDISDDEAQQNTAAWDKFWSTKSGHPMRSTSIVTGTDCGFHVLRKSNHVMGNNQSSDENKAPFSKRAKMFVNGTGLRKSTSAKNTVSNTTNPFNPDGTTLIHHGYPVSSLALTSSPFVDYEKEKYLMIWTSDYDTSIETVPTVLGEVDPPLWTDVYNPTGVFHDGIPTPGPGAYAGGTADKRHGSFDIKLRTKCTYSY